MAHHKIMAILTAKEGLSEDLMALLSTMVAPSRAEPGNLRWDIWRDTSDPNRFVLDELYADAAAVDHHRATPHFQHYLSRVNDLATRVAVVAEPVQVRDQAG